MNCKTFQNELPDLVVSPEIAPSPAADAHLKGCPACAEELRSFQQTFAALDSWTAPEISPYFDQKMHVLLRQEIAAPKMGWFESLATRLQLNTGRQFRPAMAGALALALILGGGGAAELGFGGLHGTPVKASATVQDLQILDRNEQAFQQMDQLQQDEDSAQPVEQAQPAVQPES